MLQYYCTKLMVMNKIRRDSGQLSLGFMRLLWISQIIESIKDCAWKILLFHFSASTGKGWYIYRLKQRTDSLALLNLKVIKAFNFETKIFPRHCGCMSAFYCFSSDLLSLSSFVFYFLFLSNYNGSNIFVGLQKNLVLRMLLLQLTKWKPTTHRKYKSRKNRFIFKHKFTDSSLYAQVI